MYVCIYICMYVCTYMYVCVYSPVGLLLLSWLEEGKGMEIVYKTLLIFQLLNVVFIKRLS